MFGFQSKKRAAILNGHSKIKKGHFFFEKISSYWDKGTKKSLEPQVSDRTYRDMGMDELFMFIDRTASRIGQQYLYHLLRTIPKDKHRIKTQEKWIAQLANDTKLKETCVIELNKLNEPEAYYLSSLFQDEYLKKPKWFWTVQSMALMSMATFLIAFILPQFWILLIFLLIINYCIHYWNKRNVYQYSSSIPQLLRLIRVSKKLQKLTEHTSGPLSSSTTKLDQLGKALSIFKVEDKLKSDIGQIADFILETIKAIFLIEPIILFQSLKKLELRKDDIHALFKFVGEIDSSLSILSLRNSMEIHCPLTLNEDIKELIAEGLYHPLLEHPVANSINLRGKSVLLTGSNMSGKTTFIRTIGINAIMGQTLNVCFAKNLVIPKMNVHSVIHMADDLMSDKSYYFEEVLTIKSIIEESTTENSNLFLLDELFKGTNTLERIAAGKSVLSYLNSPKNIVFIATHDIELVEYLSEEYDLYHFSETVENGQINFDYKLKLGNLQQTNAIKILDVNGFPKNIIEEANRIVMDIKEKSLRKTK